jgi:hypothetical protein
MSYQYAVVSNDEESVVEFRSYSTELHPDNIKKLPNGRLKVRPLVQNFSPTTEFVSEELVTTIESDRVVRSNVLTPLPLGDLKTKWTKQTKSIARAKLNETDWMVIRKAERGIDIPESTQVYRAAVIAEADRIEEAIKACNNVNELIFVINNQSWE